MPLVDTYLKLIATSNAEKYMRKEDEGKLSELGGHEVIMAFCEQELNHSSWHRGIQVVKQVLLKQQQQPNFITNDTLKEIINLVKHTLEKHIQTFVSDDQQAATCQALERYARRISETIFDRSNGLQEATEKACRAIRGCNQMQMDCFCCVSLSTLAELDSKWKSFCTCHLIAHVVDLQLNSPLVTMLQ
ncbi:hypothetical protein Ciccas_011046 [Cichlidogyrus casuarinus]|uniref:Uncharacterized protein n=1 Tax=Cichlidogyrus casuarinus TaxID=1844966 RepID=A0ABD2PT69_9PLAT